MTLSTLAEFQPHVDSSFQLDVEGASHQLVLKEAARLGSGARAGGSFTLLFQGAADLELPQGIYRLRSDDVEVELFLVPVGPFGNGRGFEAIFN